MDAQERLTQALQKKIKVLEEMNKDLKTLYENTLEHSTVIENDLEEKNEKINRLLDNMKKYLSKQLFDSIVGGRVKTDFSYERRKLTIFFSDIEGFTELTDSVEAETLSEFLNSYLNEMSKIATEYGGTIDKYIGDAIMVFFGAPEFITDEIHAKSCVKMAMAMQEKMILLNQIWRQKGIRKNIRIRIGINTGYCTVGNFGSNEKMDYTIVGGPVNAASRLEESAKPGGIFISGSTYELVKDMVHVNEKGKIDVKGIHYPIEVFEVIGFKNLNIKTENPFIEENENGFFIKNMLFDKDITSTEDRKLMLSAIRKAKEILKD